MNIVSDNIRDNGRTMEGTSAVVPSGSQRRVVSTGMSGFLGTSNDGLVVDEEMAVIAAPPEAAMMFSSTAEDMAPAEIPPEPSGTEYADDDDDDILDNSHDINNKNRNDSNNNNSMNQDDDDDESEYEYEDDDDAAFSGFLMAGQPLQNIATNAMSHGAAEPARIREEEDDEDDDEEVADVPLKGGSATTDADQSKQQPPVTAAPRSPSRKSKWREPSREAVNMSLRAERETTGGKRRLALDLYRIMNQDTEEAGFSLQPKSEDAMDKWTIKLFQFDEDSHLAKDLLVLGLDHVELEMGFPEHYPYEPPFVRVVRPRFKRQTGFVMNGALCMELLTKDGWNPVNDIESVIVSIRSLLVVGDGRLQAACDMPKQKYESQLAAAKKLAPAAADEAKDATRKRQRSESGEQQLSRRADDKESDDSDKARSNKKPEDQKKPSASSSSSATEPAGGYSMAEAMAAYTHLSDYHARKGWDNSGWWTRKG